MRGYFDQGPTAWKMPSRELEPFAAGRSAMCFDRNAEAFGIEGFRAAVSAMPDAPSLAIAAIVKALRIPSQALGDYLHRARFGIAGWAGHVRYPAWRKAPHGRRDDRMVDLLAIFIDGQATGLSQLR